MNVHSGASQRISSMVLATIVLVASGAARAQSAGINPYACGPLNPPGQYGPFDYRLINEEIRHRVEDYHFTAPVQQARGGVSGTYGGDVDYTLRAFPNNPRALLSISRFSLTHRTEHPPGTRYQTECYFERAIRFQPNDPMVYLIYAMYLKDRNRLAETRAQLDQADRVRGDLMNFDFDYNLGLLYYDIGDYDKALVAAKRAYALGAPMPALEKKLKDKGKWRDDPVLATPAPTPAPGSIEQGPAAPMTEPASKPE